MNIKKTVKDILAREYNLKSVEEYMVFSTDLKFRNLDMVVFMMLLEQELGYDLPREISTGFGLGSKMTVGDLIKKVEAYARTHPVAGLYSVVDGNAICCLSDKKCSKISKKEVAQNKDLDNLCAQRKCVLECNFQRLKQIIK